MLYDDVKGNISRQELQLIEAGQHYKSYSAKVKYSPENIEKEDFFKLCYGMLTKCDEITVYTFRKGIHEVCYKFIVINVDIENKQVDVRMISKVNFLTDEVETIQSMETTELTMSEVQKAIEKAVKALSEVIADLDAKVELHAVANQTYQSDTDDQLEEIENRVEGLYNGKESTESADSEGEIGESKIGEVQGSQPKTETSN